VPSVFDVEAVLQQYPTSYKESMNTVLTQECIRYNGLLAVMKKSLQVSDSTWKFVQ
jgi:dynein heavy chain